MFVRFNQQPTSWSSLAGTGPGAYGRSYNSLLHRSAWNRLRLRWTRTSLDSPTTPRLLEPWQLLQASPTSRARGQSPTSQYRGIPTNINRPIFPIPAGDSTPIPVRCMPQMQQPSIYAAPPPTRCPRQYFSAVASDRRCQPQPKHGRYFGFVPQHLHLQPPSNRTRRSFADRHCSHQCRPEVLRQRLPRLFISNPIQQHSTKRRPTSG